MSRYDQPPRRAARPKQNSFFGGAAILAAGIAVVKVIGMFYKIPLGRIIGSQGYTDFNNAYNIYAVLLTVSTAGLPVAVSKLVSEANALGRRNQMKRTFRVALAVFLILGGMSFLIMYFRAEWLAGLMHDSRAAAGIRALSPAVVCVGCLAAFRGYSQGHSRMAPTSVSQIIEALCKLFVGLSLAYFLTKAGQPANIAAAGAITGVTVGTIVALAYMALNYAAHQRDDLHRYGDVPDPAGEILRGILVIAVPITLSSSMVGIVTVIESSLMQGQLQRVLLENPDSWEIYQNFVDFQPLQAAIDAWKAAAPGKMTMSALVEQVEAAQTSGVAATAAQSAAVALHSQLEDVSRSLFGNYGVAMNIYNLPTSLTAAMTAAVIPAISAALARRARREAARISGSAMRITALLAFPMSIGLFVLGVPIMKLIYPTYEPELAGRLLSTQGIATMFVCTMLVCNSILQANGFVNLPVIVMLTGGILEVFINYNIVAVPRIGLYGAPLGAILDFSLCLFLDLLLIARVIPRRPAYFPNFAKPFAASALRGGCAWAVYGLGSKALTAAGLFCSVDEATQEVLGLSRTGNALLTLGAIGAGVVVYFALVIALHALSREDLALMPKGDKLARLLRL